VRLPLFPVEVESLGNPSMLDDHRPTMLQCAGTQSIKNMEGHIENSSRACCSVWKHFGRNIRATVVDAICYSE
jgi:hypothetical protein